MDPELADLLNKINNDPDFVNSMDEAQVIACSKKLNPYRGALTASDDKFTCLSVSNLRDRHIADTKMTSLVGFMYRAWNEYESWFDVPDVAKSVQYNEAMNIRKRIIKQFLDHLFEYNPDRHVSPALWPNTDDPERPSAPSTIAEEALMELKAAREGAEVELDEAARASEQHGDVTDVQENASERVQDAVERIAEIDKNIGRIEQVIANKRPKTLTEAKLKKYRPVDIMGTHVPVPSWDIWEKWQRYEEQNYDAIRATSATLYCDKPDFDYMIQVHGTFDSEDEAKKYAADNAHNIMFDVATIKQSQWTFLGPFKQNRDRIEFYNQNNSILKAVHDRVIQDQVTAKELMRNTVRREKKRKAVTHGPGNSKELGDYVKSMGTASGMQPVLSTEEQEEIDDLARRVAAGELDPREVYENVDEDGIPNDAIVVPTLHCDGKTVERRQFFSKAFNPEGAPMDKTKKSK